MTTLEKSGYGIEGPKAGFDSWFDADRFAIGK
jgi:hypothetical protein